MSQPVAFLKLHKEAFEKDMAALDKRMDRATMYGLREVGRRFKQVAARNAPVYKGSRASKDKAAIKAAKKSTRVSGSDVIPGLLKSSIHSSRRLKQHGQGAYSLVVAPRGARAHLYAAKMERLHPYMRLAHGQVGKDAPAIFEKSWRKAMKR